MSALVHDDGSKQEGGSSASARSLDQTTVSSSSLASFVAAEVNRLKSDIKAELQAELRAEMKADVKADMKVEMKAEVKAELRAEMKAEVKAELKTELKTELKAELRAEMKAEVKAELNTELKTELKAELRSEMKAELKSELGSEIKAEMRADITHEVEAKVDERLNAGNHVASLSPSTDEGEENDGTPRLSRVWQGMLFVASLPCPACTSLYAWTGQSWYFGVAQSLFSLCLSCIVLLVFSSPANKSIEKPLVGFASFWLLAGFGGTAVGCFITDEEGEPFWGWLCIVCIPYVLGILYFNIIARRKIGEFPHRRLKEYGESHSQRELKRFTRSNTLCFFYLLNFSPCYTCRCCTLSPAILLVFFSGLYIGSTIASDAHSSASTPHSPSFPGFTKQISREADPSLRLVDPDPSPADYQPAQEDRPSNGGGDPGPVLDADKKLHDSSGRWSNLRNPAVESRPVVPPPAPTT